MSLSALLMVAAAGVIVWESYRADKSLWVDTYQDDKVTFMYDLNEGLQERKIWDVGERVGLFFLGLPFTIIRKRWKHGRTRRVNDREGSKDA